MPGLFSDPTLSTISKTLDVGKKGLQLYNMADKVLGGPAPRQPTALERQLAVGPQTPQQGGANPFGGSIRMMSGSRPYARGGLAQLKVRSK